MNAFAAAEQSGKADSLRGELEALFEAQNRSGRADVTIIPAAYLLATIARR
jgi:hypothetical protein